MPYINLEIENKLKMMNRWKRLVDLTIYFFIELFRLNGIRINSTANLSCFGKMRPNNFGDDLNMLFIREIAKKKIIYYPNSILSKLFKCKNYICIGSTIESRSNCNAVIWGAGMISNDKDFCSPKKVCAVRGKLTERRLLNAGIPCPGVYGDPALLLPLYYKSNSNDKKYDLGIIPHYVDLDNQYIQELLKTESSVVLINVANYNDWHIVIDTIISCRYIVSSSLHGLIVSDAYGIPNIWVEYSNKITGNRFKFYDYYSSVNKNNMFPIEINRFYDKKELIEFMSDYQPIKFDFKTLIDACPFQLKTPIYCND